MTNSTRKQFSRIIGFILAMVLFFTSVPSKLYAEVIGTIGDTSPIEQDFISDSTNEHGYETQDTDNDYKIEQDKEYDYETEEEKDYNYESGSIDNDTEHESDHEYDSENKYGTNPDFNPDSNFAINSHSIKGVVVDTEGKALYGVSVSVVYNNFVIASAETDVFGRYFISSKDLEQRTLKSLDIRAKLDGFLTKSINLANATDSIDSSEDARQSTIDFTLERIDAIARAISPFAAIGETALWQVSHEIGRSGEYVDVRFQLVQTTEVGMGVAGFALEFDPDVLANPRRSPRLLREDLAPAQQSFYDFLIFQGYSHEHIAQNQMAQHAGTNSSSFGLNLFPEPLVFEGKEHTFRFGWTGFTSDSGIFVDIRFDILPNATPGVSDILFRDTVVTPYGTFSSGMTARMPGDADPDFSVSDGSVTIVVDNINVRVEDTEGNLLPDATLEITRGGVSSVSGVTIEPGTGENAGTFVVSGVTVDDTFIASASGFYSTTHPLLVTEAVDGATVTIVLSIHPPQGVTVNVMDSLGDLIPTASLNISRAGATSIPGIGSNAGSFSVGGIHIGDVLTASAAGFANVTHTITAQDLDNGTISIVMGGTNGYESETVTVRVEYPSGTLLPTANLSGVAGLTSNNDGSFTVALDGRDIGSTLTASAAGFTNVTHTITAQDLDNGTITIVMGGTNGYESETVTVRVEYPAGTLLPTASLSGVAGITSNNDGSFTVALDGRDIGSTLTASAAGFANVTHTTTAQDLDNGTITIVMGGTNGYESETVTVRVEYPSGTLLPTANLSGAAGITSNNDGSFTVALDGRDIGSTLTASAAGFTNVTHTITAQDLDNGTITIVMGGTNGYENETVTVRVEYPSGTLLPTASLSGVAGITSNNDGSFTVVLDGRDIGSTLTASAAGFANVTHTITAQDLDNGTITIVMGGTNGYENVTFTVRVSDRATPETPLLASSLTHSGGVTVSGSDGSFTITLTGQHIGTGLSASALGFVTETHEITAQDLADPNLVILLDAGEGVAVRVDIVDSNATPIPTARLTREGVTVTPAVGYSRTFQLTSGSVGQVLEASAPGFANVTHPITAADIEAGVITIVLGSDTNEYEDVNVTVNVVHLLNNVLTPLPTATITFDGTISSVGSTFILSLNGSHNGQMISASAPGFVTNTHTITFADLAAANPTITIVLGALDREPQGAGFEDVDVIVQVENYNIPGVALSSSNLTANLTPNATQTGDSGEWMLRISGAHIGQSLSASALGFNSDTHQITAQDLASGVITVRLDYGEALLINVYVVDENGVRVGGASVVHEDPAVTISNISGVGAFQFSATVALIGSNLSVSAPYFEGVTREMTSADLELGSITITLTRIPMQVVQIRVYHESTGVNRTLLPAARVSGIPAARLTNRGNGTFTANFIDSDIGQVLTVDAPGFTFVNHTITAQDIEAGVIIIVLGSGSGDDNDNDNDRYRDEVIRVTIVNSAGNRLQGARLEGVLRIVVNNDGTFTVTADGSDIGRVLTASAPHFISNTHTIMAFDLRDREITIILSAEESRSGGRPDSGGWVSIRPPNEAANRQEEQDTGYEQRHLRSGVHERFIYGYPDRTVRADAAITRGEAAAILFRVSTVADRFDPVPLAFNDVGHDSWYSQAINYLAHVGILLGYPDGSFRADDAISRAEFTALITRFSGATSNTSANFVDVDNAHWATPYINAAARNGWVFGHMDATFRPQRAITRAEAVVIMNRILERDANPHTIRDNLGTNTVFSDIASGHWAFYDIIEASITHSYLINQNGAEEWTNVYLQVPLAQ